MNLLSRNGEQLIFSVLPSELRAIRGFLALAGKDFPGPANLSKSQAAEISAEAREDFRELIARERTLARKFLSEIFRSGTNPRLTPGKVRNTASGLSVSVSDVEQMLQAVNDIKMAQWESLGCPDWEHGNPEASLVSPESARSLMLIQLANQLQAVLLSALDE